MQEPCSFWSVSDRLSKDRAHLSAASGNAIRVLLGPLPGRGAAVGLPGDNTEIENKRLDFITTVQGQLNTIKV